MKLNLVTNNSEKTLKLAATFAKLVRARTIFLLSGNLGAGKTTFAQGFAKGLGIKEIVNSPTFNIVKVYESGRITLFHIDAYRLEGINKDIGLDEYINSDGVSLIEWPEYIAPVLPKNYIILSFKIINETKREISIEAIGDKEEKLLAEVKKQWDIN